MIVLETDDVLTGEDVATGGGHVVGGHEPDAQERHEDPPVADQVGHKPSDVTRINSLFYK